MWPAGTLQNLTCERKAGLGAQRHGGRLLQMFAAGDHKLRITEELRGY